MYVKEGVVQIKPLTSLDDGYYQCRASNQHGTALSNVTVLQRAILQSYGQPSLDEKSGLVEGQPFKLNYVATKCVPRPAFTWGIADDIVDKSQVVVVTNQRVQIDDDGMYVCQWRLIVFVVENVVLTGSRTILSRSFDCYVCLTLTNIVVYIIRLGRYS